MSDIAPKPAYTPHAKSPFHTDAALYRKLQTAPRRLIHTYTVTLRSGYAWKAPAKSIIRISTPDGPQVGDLNIWNAANPRERFWASRTRQLHASHVSVNDRLWSCLPYLRPMVTIVSDSLATKKMTSDGSSNLFATDEETGIRGTSKHGGRVHDLLGTRCDPYVSKMLASDGIDAPEYDFHCHSNLTRAVIPYELGEFDVHDVINLFQATGLDEQGRYFMEACPAEPSDYIELFVEMDLLLALSTCPGGDLSMWEYGDGANERMRRCCRDLKVEVFEITDNDALSKWRAWDFKPYGGLHGVQVPLGEDDARTRGLEIGNVR